MATPSILSRDQMQAQYGVNPDKAEGWDAQNNRYNTSQAGQYLYHGDLGGGNVGWYASDQPYSGGGSKNPDAMTNTPTNPSTTQFGGSVDPSLQTVKPASGQLSPSPMPYAPSIPLGSPNAPQRSQDTPYQTPGIVPNLPPGTQLPYMLSGYGQPGTYTQPGPDGTTQTAVADSFGQGSGDPMQQAARAAILNLLGTDPNNVSTTDADVAPASRAYTAAVQREAQAQQAQLAEEANQEGTLNSGATQAAKSNIGMTAAQAIGSNDANLIGQKQQQRIQQLQTGIQVASSLGMQQEANDLQRQLANLQAGVTERGQDVTQAGQQLQTQLANLDTSSKLYLGQLSAQLQREGYSEQDRLAALDAEVRKLGINTQGDLGQLDIALRQQLGFGQLNLGLLQTLLQNQQAGNALGFNIGQWQSILNQNTVNAGLGG